MVTFYPDFQHVPADAQFKCDDCGWSGDIKKIGPLSPDMVHANEICPAGSCPECRASVMAPEKPPRKGSLTVDLYVGLVIDDDDNDPWRFVADTRRKCLQKMAAWIEKKKDEDGSLTEFPILPDSKAPNEAFRDYFNQACDLMDFGWYEPVEVEVKISGELKV